MPLWKEAVGIGFVVKKTLWKILHQLDRQFNKEEGRAKHYLLEKYEDDRPKIHHMTVKSIKDKIKDAEKLHKKLEKEGHPKAKLNKLKKVIESHKKKLEKL